MSGLCPVQDLNSANIWSVEAQQQLDAFRTELSSWHYGPCEVCNRFLPFYQKNRREHTKCSHCRSAVVSKFGPENDMDPGPVYLSCCPTDCTATTRAAESHAVRGDVDCSSKSSRYRLQSQRRSAKNKEPGQKLPSERYSPRKYSAAPS